MEASETSIVESQVKPLTQSAGVNDPDIKLENLDSGLVWGLRSGHVNKDSVPENVVALIDPSNG